MILMAAFVVMYLNTIGGAAALIFYVSYRRPTRNNLQDFQATLPKFLQDIYFNRKQAAIYSRDARRSGFEYLIKQTDPSEETGFFSSAFGLIIYLIMVYGIILLSVSRNPDDGFYYFLLALTPIRVVFFGVKIKRDPDSYMPL